MKYRNITVSGEIATGTTTLALRLAQDKLGWEYINVGKWFRQYCREHNLPLEETGRQSDEVHRQMDEAVLDRLRREEKLVVEGWLAGFMARDIPGVLKVLLVAPMAVRVKRFMKREGVSEPQAQEQMVQRTKENLAKWGQMYGTTEFFKKDWYDLVVDTGVNDEEQTLAQVYGKITDINDGNFS